MNFGWNSVVFYFFEIFKLKCSVTILIINGFVHLSKFKDTFQLQKTRPRDEIHVAWFLDGS